MDSVVVTNVTRNWTESVVYPDTIIVVGGTVGNNLNIVTNMGLEQNVPNPFDCETRVELAVLKREDVRMQLLDVAGHVCAEYTGSLNEGVHVFDISAANPQTYILNAIIGSRSYSIRMVNVGSGCGCSIKYSGLGKGIVRKFETANEFELGDDMQYVGYATVDGDLVVSDTVEQSLTESQCVTLHFTRSLPHVETLAASSVTNLSAILHGRITGTGGSSIIACGFYYGTSEDDLSQNATAILTDSMFSYELAGLTTGTTYYYKAYATNGVGTGYGEVRYFVATDDIYMADGIGMNLECGQTYNFYDSGGPDQPYGGSENMTATFTANGRIMLSFSNFHTESSFDYMSVYDGDAASGNMLGNWGGNSVPLPVTSYTGTLTVVWHSDGSLSYSGWEATISVDCEPLVPVVPCVTTSAASYITVNSVILNGIVTNDGGASITACGFYYGTSEDNLSQNVPAILTDSGFSYELTNLEIGTIFFYKAYATNDAGTGYGEVMSFSTTDILMANGINVSIGCGESLNFYDSGGPDGPYRENENMTATFTSEGRITLSFSEFRVEYMWDRMRVYDGNTSGVLLASMGGTDIPASVTACSGVMTIVWQTDAGSNYSGWGATILADCNEATVPDVVTVSVGGITAASATFCGEVTNDGLSSISERGFQYGTSPDSLTHTIRTNNRGMGLFSDSTDWLAPNTVYYFRAYATNCAGMGYGDVMSFTSDEYTYFGTPGEPFTDTRDGYIYSTVLIGSQTWMAENLRYVGDIQFGSTNSSLTPYYYYPNNDSANVFTYGYLYNWYAAMTGEDSSDANPSGVQGICPDGWHLPSASEWTQLIEYLGEDIGVASMLAGNMELWDEGMLTHYAYFGSARFDALPAGFFMYRYYNFGNGAGFWSATEDDDSYETSSAYYRNIISYLTSSESREDNKTNGYSVRCVKNE